MTLLLVGGCGDDMLSSGGNGQISYLSVFSIGTETVGNSVTVEVGVVDSDGFALSGQTVAFSVSPSSLGYFSPASDTSDADGVVTTTFTATASGRATLSATTGQSSKTYVIDIMSNSSSQGLVSVQVVPQILIANGTDQATVSISAVDSEGAPVEDGTIIYLTAGERFEDRNQDGYWSNNVDSLIFDGNANHSWDPIGTIPSTATTSGGSATVSYIAGNQATTVYIRATVIEGEVVDFAEASVKLNPSTTVANITLTHEFEDLRVRGVGGIEWTEITATAFDEHGNRVPDGVDISFTIAAGPGGGEKIQNEGYGPVTVSTNQNGQASVTLYSGTISGTIKMRAESGSIVSAVTQIVINAGPAANISVGAEQCNQRSWDYVNVQNGIGANVSDIWGNPVPDSTVIWFSTEEGFVIAHSLTGEGTPKGIANSVWFSGNPRNDGIVYVYACTDGGEHGQLCDTVAFFSSGPAQWVNILSSPPSLMADGVDKGIVYIEARDLNQNWMVNGTAVEFDADFGTIAGGGIVDGCVLSIFETEYTSETLERDYSPVHPDDGIGVVSVVRVVVGGMGGPDAMFQTAFLTGETYYKNSVIDIQTEIEPGMTVPFTISIKDRAGNPLGGHELDVITTVGTISGESFVTDKYGEIFLWFQAPPAVGSALITVGDTDPRGQVSFAQKIDIKYPD
ncbi:MAG: Ig-like domain-containing protein [bacterium]